MVKITSFNWESFLNQCTALAKLERLIAVLSILIPAILYWADDSSKFRNSVSAYADMDNSYIFGGLLTIVAMMFIFNGFFYIRRFKSSAGEGKHSRWYNIVLGMALLGVVFFHYRENEMFHYFFAIVFFLGSAFIIAFFNNKRFKKSSYLIAFLSIISLLICFLNTNFNIKIPLTSWLNLLTAEWIALSVIAIHYMLESYAVIYPQE